MSKIIDKLKEAIYQCQASRGTPPELLVLHSEVFNNMVKEMEEEERYNFLYSFKIWGEDIKIWGVDIETSNKIPKDRFFIYERKTEYQL